MTKNVATRNNGGIYFSTKTDPARPCYLGCIGFFDSCISFFLLFGKIKKLSEIRFGRRKKNKEWIFCPAKKSYITRVAEIGFGTKFSSSLSCFFMARSVVNSGTRSVIMTDNHDKPGKKKRSQLKQSYYVMPKT